MEYEGDGDINCNWNTRNGHQSIGSRTGRFGNKKTSGDHPDYIFLEIGQNAKKSPVDLRRLAVTQTPVENDELTFM